MHHCERERLERSTFQWEGAKVAALLKRRVRSSMRATEVERKPVPRLANAQKNLDL